MGKATKDKAQESAAHERGLTARMVTAIVQSLKAEGGRIWSQLNQTEQNSLIKQMETAAEAVVKEAVVFAAGQKWDAVPVTIKGAKYHENGKVDFPVRAALVTDEVEHAARRVGGNAVLVLADHAEYAGGEMPEAEPDQRNLKLVPGVDFDENAGKDGDD